MFIFTFVKNHKISFIIAIIAVIGLFIFNAFWGNSNVSEDVSKNERFVETVSVRELLSSGNGLKIIGEVSSVSEALVRSETQGVVTNVYYDIGDNISAGTVIGETEDKSQRASLLRSEAALKSAESQLALAESGSVSSVTSFTNSIQNSYATAEDAIRNKVDTFFTSDSADDKIKRILDLFDDLSLRVKINAERSKVRDILDDWRISVQSLSESSDTTTYFDEAKSNLQHIQGFLNNVVVAVNLFEPTVEYPEATIASFKLNAATARSSVNSALDSLVSAESSLARNGSGGSENQNVLIAEANVKQAEAGLLTAQDDFEKTVFRAPISGTINEIFVERGDFVSSFQEIVTIANNNALEIKAFITENDRARVSVGSKVIVADKYDGVVTRIAPALDSQTKKIKVIIGIEESNTDLINGQSVNVNVETDEIVEEFPENQEIILPISAIKVEANRTVVFTVENGVLVAIPIKTGSILGGNIVIDEGVTLDMFVVLDARGLKEGQQVNSQ